MNPSPATLPSHRRRRLIAWVLLAVTMALPGCGGTTDPPAGDSRSGGEELVGLFRVTPGACEADQPSGSYFRMVQPGGAPEAGPYVTNGDSACADPTVTPLLPGSDGGLQSGVHQPGPSAAFDAGGNALSTAIVQPAKWFAVSFGLASNPVDPQTGAEVAAPTVSVKTGRLSGDLRALGAAWNGQHFNQGSPKPDGSAPGNTAAASGTYDEGSGAYILEWASQIVGGPFDNFTGVWHLEGRFEPAG